jgi:hypothetical protein
LCIFGGTDDYKGNSCDDCLFLAKHAGCDPHRRKEEMKDQAKFYGKNSMGYIDNKVDGHKIVSNAFYFYDSKNKCYWYYRKGTTKPSQVLVERRK